MINLRDHKKLFVFGKRFASFSCILVMLLLVFSCSNLMVNDGGSLIISTPGARAVTGNEIYTIELTGSSGSSQSKTVSGGSTVQFDNLAPDTYRISVKAINERNVAVCGGTASAIVKSGETASVMVVLEDLIGELTVKLSGNTATKYTIELKDSKGSTQSKEVSAAGDVKFDELPLGSYSISVTGSDADTIVCFGTSSATIKAREPATATVSLAGIVNDFVALKTAISTGGIIYVGSDIEINETITTTNSDSVTIQAAYKDVTLSWTGTTNPMFQPTSGDWNIGGGEHSITLVGGSMSKSIIKISADATPKVTLTTNGVINIKNSSQCGVIISDENTASNGIFCLDGGSITGSTAHSVEVYANGQFIMERGSIEVYAERSVHMGGGTFSMNNGEIKNTRPDTSSVTTYGVFVTNGSFTFKGGTISKGIVVGKSDLFTISGSATVDTIMLNGSGVYFTVGGKLKGNSTVATIIIPNSYKAGDTILKAADGVDLTTEVEKFKVTQESNGTQWAIGTDGKLQ